MEDSWEFYENQDPSLSLKNPTDQRNASLDWIPNLAGIRHSKESWAYLGEVTLPYTESVLEVILLPPASLLLSCVCGVKVWAVAAVITVYKVSAVICPRIFFETEPELELLCLPPLGAGLAKC